MSKQQVKQLESIESLTKRQVRALTEVMTVFGGEGEIYSVVGENGGGTYTVDPIQGRCTCPDAKHNLKPNETCKHEHRVKYATGRQQIPDWVDENKVDDHFGALVESKIDDCFGALVESK